MYFDKKNYRILKAIYNKDGITSAELQKRFDDCEMFLISLAQESYIGAQSDDGKFLRFGSLPFATSENTKWFTLPRGNCIIEDKRWRVLQWSIPVIISATAVVISIVSLTSNSTDSIREILSELVDALSSHIA